MRVAVIMAVTACAAATASTVAASPLTDAIARPDDAAVAALRAQLPGDASLRCTLGAVYERRHDLSRADLYLAGCDTAALDAGVADPVARAVRELAHALRTSELAAVDIVIQPGGLDAEIDALPGERFTVPRVVWVPAGHRVVRVFADGKPYDVAIEARAYAHNPMVINLVAPPAPAPRVATQDFTADEPAQPTVEGPPPDVQHPAMKIGIMVAHEAAGGDAIADPFAAHPAHSALVLGIRAGGGVFDETGGPSRFGPSVAAVASLALASRLALDLRVDWTRRGSDGVDAIGVTLGPTVTALRMPSFALRAGAGARADLRLESSIVYFPPHGVATPQLAEVANDTNVSAAGWLEVPLRAVPMTLAARYERSLTSLGFGVHDQAVIVEAGFELR